MNFSLFVVSYQTRKIYFYNKMINILLIFLLMSFNFLIESVNLSSLLCFVFSCLPCFLPPTHVLSFLLVLSFLSRILHCHKNVNNNLSFISFKWQKFSCIFFIFFLNFISRVIISIYLTRLHNIFMCVRISHTQPRLPSFIPIILPFYNILISMDG